MYQTELRRNGVRAAIFIASCLCLVASAAPHGPTPLDDKPSGTIALLVNPSLSKIKWELNGSVHTVHGTFKVSRGTVEFDPATAKASGEIVVDARSGESGNDSRDKKMHNDVLESAKFGEIVFHPDRVEGKVASSGSSAIQIHGTFDIHGSKQQLTIPLQVELSADSWKGTAKFRVPYAAWGMKNPSNFFLKVDPSVELEVEMHGSLGAANRLKH